MTEDITPAEAEAVVSSLLAAAEGNEPRAIMRAGVRAGLLWRCPCQQVNYLTRETCGGCREARQDRIGA